MELGYHRRGVWAMIKQWSITRYISKFEKTLILTLYDIKLSIVCVWFRRHSQMRHSQMGYSHMRHTQMRHSQIRKSQIRNSQIQNIKCDKISKRKKIIKFLKSNKKSKAIHKDYLLWQNFSLFAEFLIFRLHSSKL